MVNKNIGKCTVVQSFGVKDSADAAKSMRETHACVCSSQTARQTVCDASNSEGRPSISKAVSKRRRVSAAASRQLPKTLLVLAVLLGLFAASQSQFTVTRALFQPISTPNTAIYTKQGTNGVDYREYGTGEKVFWCTPGDKAASAPWEAGKVFDKLGTLKASAPNTLDQDLRYSSVLMSDMKVWVSSKSALGVDHIVVFQITNTLGTFSIAQSGASLVYDASTYGTGGFNDPGTNFIYLGASTVHKRLQRLDTVARTFVIGTVTNYSDIDGDTYRMYAYPGDLILFSGAYNFVYVATKSTMDYLDKIDTRAVPATAPDERSFTGLMDNLSPTYFHSQAISGAANAKKIKALRYTGGPGFTDHLPQLSLIEPGVYGMANLGTLQYYVVSRITSTLFPNPLMSVISKLTNTAPASDFISQVGQIALTSSTSGMSFMEMDNTDAGYVGVFGSKKDTTASNFPNFNSYLVIMDICIIRVADICASCPSLPSQTYYSSLLAFNRCWTKSQFPAKHGVNLTNSVVTACSQATCLDCKDDHTKCIDCDGTDVLREDTWQCVTNVYFDTNPVPTNYGFVVGGPKSIVRRCQLITCSDCRVNYTVCADPGPPVVPPPVVPPPAPPSNLSPFVKTPQVDAASIITDILKGINFAFKALLMPINGLVAYQIDRTIAFCSFLRVIEGPLEGENFSVIHHLSSTTLFPFWISNPYAESVRSSCQTKSNYVIHGVACNFLSNYGQNINIIFAALVLNSLVCLVYVLAYKKPEGTLPESSGARGLRTLNRFFGFRYFFTFMDGVSLELFGWMIVNIVGMHYDSSGPMVGGFILSLVVLVYYMVSGFYMFKFLGNASELRKSKTGSDTAELQYSSLDFVIQNYRPDLKQPFMIYTPLAILGKNFTYQIFALILSNQKFGMVVFVCIIEAAFLGYTCWARVRKTLIDNLFDIFTSLVTLLYFVVKGTTFETTSAGLRDRYHTMNILLLLLNCVHIVFALYTTVISIIPGFSSVSTVAPKQQPEKVRPSSPKESSKIQMAQSAKEAEKGNKLESNPPTLRDSPRSLLPESESKRRLNA
jgi:hypothetical protein